MARSTRAARNLRCGFSVYSPNPYRLGASVTTQLRILRDLAALLGGCLLVFYIDISTPPSIAAGFAYVGLVLLAQRPNQVLPAGFTAAVATL